MNSYMTHVYILFVKFDMPSGIIEELQRGDSGQNIRFNVVFFISVSVLWSASGKHYPTHSALVFSTLLLCVDCQIMFQIKGQLIRKEIWKM